MYKSNYFKCAVYIKFYWAITSNGRQWFGNGTIHLLFNEPMPKKTILQIHRFYYIRVQFTYVVYVDIGDVAFTSEHYEISVANFFILPLKKSQGFIFSSNVCTILANTYVLEAYRSIKLSHVHRKPQRIW